MNRSLAVLLVICCVPAAIAVQCYECESSDKLTDCMDVEPKFKPNLYNNDNVKRVECQACFKSKPSTGDVLHVKRGCAPESRTSPETECVTVSQYNKPVIECTCDTDLCNGAITNYGRSGALFTVIAGAALIIHRGL